MEDDRKRDEEIVKDGEDRVSETYTKRWERLCECMCVCTYVCVSVCVCVCVRLHVCVGNQDLLKMIRKLRVKL